MRGLLFVIRVLHKEVVQNVRVDIKLRTRFFASRYRFSICAWIDILFNFPIFHFELFSARENPSSGCDRGNWERSFFFGLSSPFGEAFFVYRRFASRTPYTRSVTKKKFFCPVLGEAFFFCVSSRIASHIHEICDLKNSHARSSGRIHEIPSVKKYTEHERTWQNRVEMPGSRHGPLPPSWRTWRKVSQESNKWSMRTCEVYFVTWLRCVEWCACQFRRLPRLSTTKFHTIFV